MQPNFQDNQTSEKKSNNQDVLLVVLAVVLIPFLLWILLSAKPFLLKLEGERNAKTLNSIEILNGQAMNAQGRPNGDTLTGSSAPAAATLETQKTLGSAYDEISKNLQVAGFTTENLLYDSGGGNGAYYWFVSKKDNAWIVVSFVVSGENNTCGGEPKFSSTLDIDCKYGAANEDYHIEYIRVAYDDNSSTSPSCYAAAQC